MANEIKIWIDALDFENKGGWKVDTQFVHLNGSGYLIAAAAPGEPVDDATTTVAIPQAGKYRIWVRDRNWLRPHNPGTFSMLLNGEHNGVILGQQPSDAWVWEIAGDFDLEAGNIELAFHDLTGYFGRFSTVLITNDFDYVPAREIERMHKERAQIKGLSTEIQYCGDYDVIIAGGGPGGVPAAIACARMGIKTLLLQNRSVLGGNGSCEIGITFDGAGSHYPFHREGGIAEEIRRLRDNDPTLGGEWTRAMEKLTSAEKNLTIAYNSHVCAVDMENETTIKGVTVLDFIELTKRSYTGKIFIDCTGDAWLGYYAGAKYRFGREASYQHDEYLAPEIADTQTMSGCIRGDKKVFFTKTEEPFPYVAPDWVPKLPDNDKEFGRNITAVSRMAWWLEAPNTYDDMWDGEQTRDALFLVILGYYDYLKNHWSGKKQAENVKFSFASITDGRRESRRLIGDYVMTQDDCTSGRKFDDAVSYTGWALDIHHNEGIYSGTKGPLYCARRAKKPHVPFRCLYSKNIDNLLFAGRNISVSHIAMGTTRVQNTIATLGQAVGTAAAMCIQLNETPRGIYQRHMKQLQQTLVKNDQFIPGIKSEDPTDPCLNAKVTASSVCTTELFRNAQGELGELLPLDVDRAVDMKFSEAEGDISEIYVKLHNSLSEPQTVTLYAQYFGGDVDTYSTPGEIVSAQAVVPPMCESWVKFDIHVPIERNKYVESCAARVMIHATPGISWRSIENLSLYQRAGFRNEKGEWEMKTSRSLCALRYLPEEVMANCGPENVVNGHNRIVDEQNYEWVSDPAQDLPQWIQVEFDKATEINNVSVVFDTDLTNPATCWGPKVPTVKQTIKDYIVEIFDGSNWIQIANEKDNIFRKRIHRFAATKVEKVKVTALATWGDKSARIMEIRASLDA